MLPAVLVGGLIIIAIWMWRNARAARQSASLSTAEYRRIAAELKLPTQPRQLEEYLERSEGAYEDIIPSAEKQIQWADSSAKARTPVCLLVIHGYSACRQELSPVGERLGDQLGANVFHTRLSGHGREHPDAMLEGTMDAFVRDVVEAYQIATLIGERVLVIGTSFGGCLGTWLASQEWATALRSMALISPCYAIHDMRLIKKPLFREPFIRKAVLRVVLGQRRAWEPANEAHARFWTPNYPSAALLGFFDMMTALVCCRPGDVKIRVLGFACPADTVVSFEAAKKRLGQMPNGELVVEHQSEDVSQGSHDLTGRILAPTTVERFIERMQRFFEESLAGASKCSSENKKND